MVLGASNPGQWKCAALLTRQQPELAHPYAVLKDKAELVVASPNGGEAPLDPGSVKMFENDPLSVQFLNENKSVWANTQKLANVLPRVQEFDAIFYVGGHGRELSR